MDYRVARFCATAAVGLLLATSARAQEFVMKCGVLEARSAQGEQCLLFTADGVQHLLDVYGGFTAGDTVLVRGTMEYWSPWTCGGNWPWIRVDSIDDCRGFDFGCGTIVVDQEGDCRSFASWRYGSFGLDHWEGHASGDTLHVHGRLEFYCITWCTWVGCIAVDSLSTCTDSLTVISPTSWGRLKAVFR